MAQKVHVELVDDLDGSAAAETVGFALDGTTYEIDLNKRNAKALRKSMEAYLSAARRVSGKRQAKKSKTVAKGSVALGPSTREIRDWARANGFEVSDRGQIPGAVREAFASAQ
jgi:hypothetical protein